MKRPLKPVEVPPGSVFRQETTFKPGEYCIPSSVREHGIHLLTEFFSWEDLKNSLWRILRPGEDWQECAVDEFNPADYKPGQEVDYPTARKLHEAGVKLEYTNRFHRGAWELNATAHVHSDNYLDSLESKFRIALPPKIRDIRPDELPERFEVVWPDDYSGLYLRSDPDISELVKTFVERGCKWRTDLNATELNSFQVEDE